MDVIGKPVWWHTSVGMFILGLLANAAIGYYGAYFAYNYLGFLGVVALFVAILAYPLWFYPKLFTQDPPTTSPLLVSFLNGLIGYLVFGILWNICLTNGKIGVSHIVFAVLMAAIAVLSFYGA